MDGPQRTATVPEHARFCPACDGPVGRSRAGRPGRERGVCPWCRAAYDLTPALGPGAALTGERDRYRVRTPLEPGARGWLYLADAEDARATVVLTRLEGPEGPAAGALAVTEPEVLVDLAVPGLVRALDVAVAAERDGPSRYLVLEHVDGRRGDGGARPAPADALDAVLAVTGPLSALHRRGLLHADVTPGNLLTGPAGTTLMDLGSVRRVGDRTSDVWGTTGFLAPEITPGGLGPSVASDVYALGRTLAVLLVEFDHTLSHAMRLPDPVEAPLLAERPDLDGLLRRATAPDPADRHPDVGAFAAHARAVRAGLGPAAPGTPTTPVPAGTGATTT